MRTQEERDEQTLDIVSMVLRTAVFWLLPILLVAVLVDRYGGNLVALIAIAAYFATVAVLLRRRGRR